MKTLIINGSPRRDGDTSELVKKLKEKLHGEIVEISPYYNKITPCLDCRQCWKKKDCVIEDDMSKIYADDFNTVVIASPLYVSTLTGPLLSLASRFQAYYAAKRFLKDEIYIRNKTAVLIIVGGGDGGPEEAVKLSKWMFKKMKADLTDENSVFSLYTDDLQAKEDFDALSKINEIACRINQKYDGERVG